VPTSLSKQTLPIGACPISIREAVIGETDRDWLPEPDPALIALLEEQAHRRPQPLRAFDQVHMNIEDAARHIDVLAHWTEGKRVLFMGDSDGIALGLVTSAHRGLVPSPSSVTVCDFDDRVLRFIESGARAFGCTVPLKVQRYNVFDPLPPDMQAGFDFFHTNPPYGMYNAGRSITAFIERCIAGIRPRGEGIVVLGNDPRREWTVHVLRAVLSYLVKHGVTPTRILQRVHRYVLDDDPELESGFVYCRMASRRAVVSENLPLPDSYIESFYGRESIRVPAFIDEFGVPVYSTGPCSL